MLFFVVSCTIFSENEAVCDLERKQHFMYNNYPILGEIVNRAFSLNSSHRHTHTKPATRARLFSIFVVVCQFFFLSILQLRCENFSITTPRRASTTHASRFRKLCRGNTRYLCVGTYRTIFSKALHLALLDTAGPFALSHGCLEKSVSERASERAR